MCGIMGIISGDQQTLPSASLLDQLVETLKERGPDGRGVFVHGHVALGHTRLAIRDPSHGAQPWVSDDRQCVLVYNGELYNDGELRNELRSFYPFRTRCDTEVILAAYLRWGIEAVNRFRGMFALGLYDFRMNRLWLVRDRMGVKPLFIARVKNSLVFSSRIPTILAHPLFSKRPDWIAISHYLTTTRLTLGRQTIYDGIEQLLPAESLVYQDGQITRHRYWNYPTIGEVCENPWIESPSSRSSTPFEKSLDDLECDLDQVVSQQLVSDVPAGMFLSGGVDSSTLGAIVRRHRSDAVRAVCAGAKERHADLASGASGPSDALLPTSTEGIFAADCADHLGFDLETVELTPDQYRDRWHDLVHAYRAPLSTPSDVLIYEISRAARQHVRVVLGGEGADELFCGYEIQHWSGSDYDSLQQLRRSRDVSTDARHFHASIRRQYGRCHFDDSVDHYFALNSLIPTQLKSRILDPSLWNRIDQDRLMIRAYQDVYSRTSSSSTMVLHSSAFHQINLEALLYRLDQGTMHAGLEARVPYTDHLLIEKVLQVPLHHRIDVPNARLCRLHGSAELSEMGEVRSKRVLRALATKYLPHHLATRKKASFPTELSTWIQGKWQSWIQSLLETSRFARVLFQAEFLQDLVQRPAMAGMWLWPIINLSLWGDAEFFS